MQNTQLASTRIYRERLTPSLWLLGGAAVVAPMTALVFAPIDATLALALGAVAGIALIAVFIALAPVIEVRGGTLYAGRARIGAEHLASARALTGDAARRARGIDLDRAGWHLIRGGIDGVVVVTNTDTRDPVPAWTISSRTPDRLAAALERAGARVHVAD